MDLTAGIGSSSVALVVQGSDLLYRDKRDVSFCKELTIKKSLDIMKQKTAPCYERLKGASSGSIRNYP